ncbi:MAG TPA: SMP-30/gluconolactonase/LRE family protein [Terriglobia bacterium]|nr:SMP-30/gluconolactonase/LRE family protein [Terriglobia bacterium]
MIKRLLCVLFVLSLSACGSGSEPAKEESKEAEATPAKPAAAELWTVAEGIQTPESVYVDPATGDVYASNVVGTPDGKDGMGHISKIGSDGKTVNAMWVSGLNAPKGLRSHQGTLYVTDIDEIVAIDMASGKVKSKVKVAGAQFLNDTAVGPDGTVYVTDMAGNKIIALKDGKTSVFAQGADLEFPNGLLVEGDSLVVGGWGAPNSPTDFTTKVPGRLFKLDLKTKAKTLITPEPTANIDGLESDGKGGYIASDFIAGKILHISADGKVETLTTYSQGTADIAFTASGNRLIIPHMMENKIVAYDISGALGQ